MHCVTTVESVPLISKRVLKVTTDNFKAWLLLSKQSAVHIAKLHVPTETSAYIMYIKCVCDHACKMIQLGQIHMQVMYVSYRIE